ncbi:unnamed protein product [Amoebophrya sp. A120]|nr:unnamed protein product [Amoebophrya sp. A120]|eukprot:GSA120T00024271001.1
MFGPSKVSRGLQGVREDLDELKQVMADVRADFNTDSDHRRQQAAKTEDRVEAVEQEKQVLKEQVRRLEEQLTTQKAHQAAEVTELHRKLDELRGELKQVDEKAEFAHKTADLAGGLRKYEEMVHQLRELVSKLEDPEAAELVDKMETYRDLKGKRSLCDEALSRFQDVGNSRILEMIQAARDAIDSMMKAEFFDACKVFRGAAAEAKQYFASVIARLEGGVAGHDEDSPSLMGDEVFDESAPGSPGPASSRIPSSRTVRLSSQPPVGRTSLLSKMSDTPGFGKHQVESPVDPEPDRKQQQTADEPPRYRLVAEVLDVHNLDQLLPIQEYINQSDEWYEEDFDFEGYDEGPDPEHLRTEFIPLPAANFDESDHYYPKKSIALIMKEDAGRTTIMGFQRFAFFDLQDAELGVFVSWDMVNLCKFICPGLPARHGFGRDEPLYGARIRLEDVHKEPGHVFEGRVKLRALGLREGYKPTFRGQHAILGRVADHRAALTLKLSIEDVLAPAASSSKGATSYTTTSTKDSVHSSASFPGLPTTTTQGSVIPASSASSTTTYATTTSSNSLFSGITGAGLPLTSLSSGGLQMPNLNSIRTKVVFTLIDSVLQCRDPHCTCSGTSAVVRVLTTHCVAHV